MTGVQTCALPIYPAKVTHDNVSNFRKQLQMLGYSFDWDREVNTTDPDYYKWTQWIFLQMFKKGLAYKASMPVNWCTSCKIVLANEEVVEGVCERCGGCRFLRVAWTFCDAPPIFLVLADGHVDARFRRYSFCLFTLYKVCRTGQCCLYCKWGGKPPFSWKRRRPPHSRPPHRSPHG